MRGRWRVLLFVLLVAVAAGYFTRPFVLGLSFVVRAADLQGSCSSVRSHRHACDVTRARDRHPDRHGIDSRRGCTSPTASRRRATLLVPDCIPRASTSRGSFGSRGSLRRSGVTVVTPDIPGLSTIRDYAAAYRRHRATARGWRRCLRSRAGDGRIGMMGISFSGGLGSSWRPAVRRFETSRLRVSLGGHDDLPRVLRYLCTGAEPYPRQQLGGQGQPFVRAPHDYGVAVILLGVADRLVPAGAGRSAQGRGARISRRSALDSVNHDARRPASSMRLRELPQTLPEPSAHAAAVRQRARCRAPRRAAAAVPRAVRRRSRRCRCRIRPSRRLPVFLLHGVGRQRDPAIESEYLADDLRGTRRFGCS